MLKFTACTQLDDEVLERERVEKKSFRNKDTQKFIEEQKPINEASSKQMSKLEKELKRLQMELKDIKDESIIDRLGGQDDKIDSNKKALSDLQESIEEVSK